MDGVHDGASGFDVRLEVNPATCRQRVAEVNKFIYICLLGSRPIHPQVQNQDGNTWRNDWRRTHQGVLPSAADRLGWRSTAHDNGQLPLKLLTASLPHKRAVGAILNWGRTLKKALEFNNLPTASHFNHLFTLANQTVPKVRNNPDPASWL